MLGSSSSKNGIKVSSNYLACDILHYYHYLSLITINYNLFQDLEVLWASWWTTVLIATVCGCFRSLLWVSIALYISLYTALVLLSITMLFSTFLYVQNSACHCYLAHSMWLKRKPWSHSNRLSFINTNCVVFSMFWQHANTSGVCRYTSRI